MNKLSIFILSGLVATGAFAQTATAVPEAQKQGSEKAQAAAEVTHNAKPHGTDKSAKQAQTAGSSKAKAAAERKHLAKAHTGKKSSTDARQAVDAKKL